MMIRSAKLFNCRFCLKARNLSTQTAVSFKPTSSEYDEAKKFEEIPGLSKFELVKRFMPGGKFYQKPVPEFQRLMREEFGNLYRLEGFATQNTSLTTYDADDIEFVHRNEGTYPFRRGMETMKYFREKIRNDIFHVGGLIVEQGHEWQQMRSVMNPILMQPRLIKTYIPMIDKIVNDFIKNIPKLQDEKGEMPGNFMQYLNFWSLESITAVTLENRLGLLNFDTKNEDGEKIQKSIRKIFTMGAEFEMKPSFWKFYQTKEFKELIQAYQDVTQLSAKMIDEAIKKYEANSTANSSHEQGILFKLLEKDKKFAVVMAFDMIFAGVDTTTSALSLILYCLAKHPEKQEKLRAELIGIMPDENTPLSEENMKNLPYLRAVIKESLRMFPPATMNMRRTSENLVLRGYQVPKGIDIMLGMMQVYQNPKYFERPLDFIPERFLRRETDEAVCPQSLKQTHAFAYLPFGYGPRYCIGKRIAEMELETFISRIFRKYKIEWHHPEMKLKPSLVLLPDSELRFKMIKL